MAWPPIHCGKLEAQFSLEALLSLSRLAPERFWRLIKGREVLVLL